MNETALFVNQTCSCDITWLTKVHFHAINLRLTQLAQHVHDSKPHTCKIGSWAFKKSQSKSSNLINWKHTGVPSRKQTTKQEKQGKYAGYSNLNRNAYTTTRQQLPTLQRKEPERKQLNLQYP
jgi:hypothetical protein